MQELSQQSESARWREIAYADAEAAHRVALDASAFRWRGGGRAAGRLRKQSMTTMSEREEATQSQLECRARARRRDRAAQVTDNRRDTRMPRKTQRDQQRTIRGHQQTGRKKQSKQAINSEEYCAPQPPRRRAWCASPSRSPVFWRTEHGKGEWAANRNRTKPSGTAGRRNAKR
jgi:hypothetical protein